MSSFENQQKGKSKMAITVEMEPGTEIDTENSISENTATENSVTENLSAENPAVETTAAAEPKKKRGRPRKTKTDAAAAEQAAIDNAMPAAPVAPAQAAVVPFSPVIEDLRIEVPSETLILADLCVSAETPDSWKCEYYTGQFENTDRQYLRNDDTHGNGHVIGTIRLAVIRQAVVVLMQHWGHCSETGLVAEEIGGIVAESCAAFLAGLESEQAPAEQATPEKAVAATASDNVSDQASAPEAAAEPQQATPKAAEERTWTLNETADPDVAINGRVEIRYLTEAEIAANNKKRQLHRSIWDTERELLSLDIEEAKAAASLKAITKERKEVRDRLLELRERLEDPQMEIEFSNDGSWSRTISDYQPQQQMQPAAAAPAQAVNPGVDAVATAVPAQPAPAADAALEPAADDAANTDLCELAISPGRVEKLAEAEIYNVGQLEIAIATGKLQHVKGIGDKAVDAITDALMDFRRENPVPCGELASEPAVQNVQDELVAAAHGQLVTDSTVATKDAEKAPELPRDQFSHHLTGVALSGIDLPEELITDNPGDNALRLRIYRAGCEAAIAKKPMKGNPHERGTRAWAIWDKGWRDITDAGGPDDDASPAGSAGSVSTATDNVSSDTDTGTDTDSSDENPQVDPADDLGDDIPETV